MEASFSLVTRLQFSGYVTNFQHGGWFERERKSGNETFLTHFLYPDVIFGLNLHEKRLVLSQYMVCVHWMRIQIATLGQSGNFDTRTEEENTRQRSKEYSRY